MKNILLIEDNKLSRIALSKTMEDEGYNVKIADNGLDGLNIYKNEDIDIVITDLFMPKLDGYEVHNKIRKIEEKENRKRIPLIIITGHRELESINDINVYFMKKPIDIEILLQKIDIMIN